MTHQRISDDQTAKIEHLADVVVDAAEEIKRLLAAARAAREAQEGDRDGR